MWAERIVAHNKLVIGAWLILAAAVFLPAPRVTELLAKDATGFLPPDVPSQQASALLESEFPTTALSRAVLLFARDEAPLSADDFAAVADVSARLDDAADGEDWRVLSPAATPHLTPLLVSPDGTAALIVLELSGEMLTHRAIASVRRARGILDEAVLPDGLVVEITGTAALGELLDSSAKRDVDATTLWAILGVAAILLAVYRSPIAMVIPLVTIGTSLFLSLGLLGWAVVAGWPVNGLVEMFIVVIVVGSGVDYCLFLFASFRRFRSAGTDSATAARDALRQTAPSILASGGTNVAGLAMLVLGLNRDLRTSGPSIALAMAIATVAVLTLGPALLALLGSKMFRNEDRQERETSPSWRAIAWYVVSRPRLVLVLGAAVVLPTSLAAANMEPLFDAIEEYPRESSFVRGANLYRQHFFGGEQTAELGLVIDGGELATSGAARGLWTKPLESLRERLSQKLPIREMRDLTQPLGARAPALPAIAGGTFDISSAVRKISEQRYLSADHRVMRADVVLSVPERSAKAMDAVDVIRSEASAVMRETFASPTVLVAGSSAHYADVRAVRSRDFRVIATAASALILAILLLLTRSLRSSLVLVGATLATFGAAYGLTFILFREFAGVSGLSYQVGFLLFIIVMSLGQDYNIYVLAEVNRRRQSDPPREAIAGAIATTGGIVSSCGIIMAAAFASMFSGTILVMKEFAVALSAGILIDTFLMRPLIVPAALLLVEGRRAQTARPASKAHSD